MARVVGLAPGLEQIAFAGAEHGLVDFVAEDIQRLGRAPRTGRLRRRAAPPIAGAEKAAPGQFECGLVSHGYFLPADG